MALSLLIRHTTRRDAGPCPKGRDVCRPAAVVVRMSEMVGVKASQGDGQPQTVREIGKQANPGVIDDSLLVRGDMKATSCRLCLGSALCSRSWFGLQPQFPLTEGCFRAFSQSATELLVKSLG